MKKLLLSCFAALLLLFGGMTSANADEYLRVGMEAAYAHLTGHKMMILMELFLSKELASTLTDTMSK